jgi:S-adenosylmethionine:tRNA ribosyltransferase-isomerase
MTRRLATEAYPTPHGDSVLPPVPLFRTANYRYDLPQALIAQEPTAHRADARLLCVPRDGTGPQAYQDAHIRDLPQLLRRGDLVIVNDTRVLPARLFGIRTSTGGRAEVLVLEHAAPTIRFLLKTRGRPLPGEVIEVAAGRLAIRLDAPEGRGLWRGTTEASPAEVLATMEAHGALPLPPYIEREAEDPRGPSDRERYQTVFARHPGAVAAPTAGLHLTDELIHALDARGIQRASVTLHVGLGTFRPVTTADLRDHPMHEERYDLPASTVDAIVACRARRGRVVAVGTTVVRVLCAAHDRGSGTLVPGEGCTDIFLHPPRTLPFPDVLLTNFHAPESTLLMLLAAFAGRDRTLAAYRHARRRGYRFLSFGDAMIVA